MTGYFTSIIIVNYNTKELTADCIRSVKKYVAPLGYEIIVVDNASADGSVDYLRRLFPGVLVISNDQNLGFGYANNIGAAKATGDYLFFLNSDTILLDDIVGRFINFYKQHPDKKIAAVGSLMISPEHTLVNSFGDFTPALKRRVNTPAFKQNAKSIQYIGKNYFAETDIVVGANMFMEKKVFDAFKGFDTNIFLYEEELEFQYRMKKSGLTSFILNEQTIIHLEGQSSPSYFKRKCSFLSLCYIYKKHLPYPIYLFTRLQQIIYAMIFFKNPRTSWLEKMAYLKLSIFKK